MIRPQNSRVRVEQVAIVNGVTWYELLEPISIHFTTDEQGFDIEVPAGFRTDFASVPRWLWAIFPPTGEWSAVSVLHDWLYRRTTCSRFLADAIFREGMAAVGVPAWRRVAAYYAVRVFGGIARRTPLPSLPGRDQ